VTEILYGLLGAQRERVAALREDERFFWVDVSLSETSLDDLGRALDISERTSQALASYAETDGPSREFSSDGHRLAFTTSCYIERPEGSSGPQRMRSLDVEVVVSGEYLLTVHEERVRLTEVLGPDIAEGRTNQYVVYSVLDAMVGTGFAALNQVELMLDELMGSATDVSARVRMATLQDMVSGLARMRRRAGPQPGLFERIGMEVERIPGLQAAEEPYFDRLSGETKRLLDAIDATGDSMANVIDLRLNEMSYLLTVVATIFLPLTFITGFFGMNFEWMIGQVDTALAFWLLGVGTTLGGALIAWRTVMRRSPIVEDGEAEGPPPRV
jgi:magnesium transporter